MIKKFAAIFAVLLLLGVSAASAQDDRSVYWNQWNVTINNVDTTHNHFDVTESYNIQFSGTFHSGYATIPLDSVTSITNVQVTEDGQQMQQDCSEDPGTVCAQNSDDGSNLEVNYYFFHPVTDSAEQIQLSYTVNGGLRIYSGGDQLWWTAIPSDNNGFSVGSSTITVQLPQGYAPRTGVDPVVTYGAPGNVDVNGTTITAKSTGQINDGTDFEIRVQYPHDPNAQAPAWQAAYDRQAQLAPVISIVSIALALLIAIGGGLFLYTLYLRKGRDPKIGPVPTFLSDPPSDLPPALVGTLVDERADPRDAISTIIDLAHRGYMAIEESQNEGVFGLGRSSTFTFKRSDKPLDGLRDFEMTMMNRLFGANRMERTMDSLRNTFFSVIAEIERELYADLVTDGFFSANPDSTRTMWSVVAVILIAIAGVVGFLLLSLTDQYGFGILLPPVAIAFLGVIAFLIGPAMPAKTPKGAEESAKWKAFYEYLRHLEKYATVENVADQFEKYLPYAVAFGLDNSWIQKFSQVPSMPIPYWYYPTYIGPYRGGFIAGSPMPYVPFGAGGGMMGGAGGIAHAAGGGASLNSLSGGLSGGLNSISHGLSGMLNSASSAMTSRPSSSGSSGSWSRGGGSFSGGGRGGFGGGGHAGGGGSRGFR